MPLYQAAVEKTNVALNRQNVANIHRGWFEQGTNLAVAMSQAASANPAAEANPNLNFTGAEQGVINAFPEVIKEVMRAAIYGALGTLMARCQSSWSGCPGTTSSLPSQRRRA